MTRIVAIADIHADAENLFKFIKEIKKEEKYDVVVAIGDFLDNILPKGFSEEETIELIIEILKTFGKPLITVPGNQDGEIIDFLKENTLCVHGNGVILDDVGFYGYGGARTPAKTSLEPSEEELSLGLQIGFEKVKKAKFLVQVTHMPPASTKLDLLPFGIHVGSEAIRKFIIEKKPNVAISGHIHEARGTDKLGSTQLVNPGRFSEGTYAVIDFEDEKTKIEIKTAMKIENLLKAQNK